ncbi:MAG: GTP pyrophosphokinase family protein [Clostridiales bacterium]|jgi:putative GTP pyrophosphokinase|nr:GTP pyrophosphokinase family protein [Clostridiales bacterium]
MPNILFPDNEFNELKKILTHYNCALKMLNTKIEILNEDYKTFHSNNPIEHYKSRLKSPESIAEKLVRKGLPLTAKAAVENLNDIAGARIICSFSNDIYEIVDILKRNADMTVIKEADYIAKPKPSGYRSYHMIVSFPIYLTGETPIVKAEIQVRTEAMDFWASLEHKVRYKYKGMIPEHLGNELKNCAAKINDLDKRMYIIHDIINLLNSEDPENDDNAETKSTNKIYIENLSNSLCNY